MRTSEKVVFALLSVMLIVVCFLIGVGPLSVKNVITQDTTQVEEIESTKNSEEKDFKETNALEAQTSEITSLKEKIAALEAEQANTEETNDNTELNDNQKLLEVTKKAFEAMVTFEPNTFEKRKENVKPYLTEDLLNNLFTNESTLGDSNGVSSETKSIEVFISPNDQEQKALVKVSAKSRIDQSEWVNSITLYEITYDRATNQISSLSSLGNVYNAETLE